METPVMSDIEKICYNWLVKHKITDFEFQSSLAGGRFELGGSVVDFTFPERSLAWRVHGDYWHCNPELWSHDRYNQTIKMTAKERWEKDDLRLKYFYDRQYNVVVLWEKQIKESHFEIKGLINESI